LSKFLLYGAYVAGTLLTAFGWLGVLAQGDALQGDPRITGVVLIFAAALAFLAISAIGLRRAKRWTSYVLLSAIALEAAFCVYVVIGQFAL
jgi:uncharacterized membrane protein (DUF2068 family)